MAGVPYYRITSCCDQDVVEDLFHIASSGVVIDGVYTYFGPSYQEPTSGMWFYSGYCYTIEYVASNFSLYPVAFNEATITFLGQNDCDNPECAACDVALPVAFSIYPCCDTDNIININIDFSSCGTFDDQRYVINYTGTGFVTPSGFVFEPGQCYHITRIENGIYETAPPCEDFNVNLARFCADAPEEFCPACELGLEYLIFTNCCTEEIILFKGIDASLYFGVRQYLGTLVNGLENICYGIQIGTVGDLTVPNVAAYNALPSPPSYVEGVTFTTLSSIESDCTLYVEQCPSCNIPCYTLYDCDGNNFNTTSDLSAYVGTFVTISNGEVSFIGSYLVLENTGSCKNAVDSITVVDANPEPCTINCYQITGNPTTVTYINFDRELVVQLGGGKVCSYITPIVTGPTIGYVVELGECIEGECPEICFEFTNCKTREVLVVSNSSSIIPYYAQNQIVTLNGYDGCWSINITEECDCPISVTILQAYSSCEECLPIVNYKFTNCNKPLLVMYSTDDYSAYVGQTVELECGECWFVSEINYVPPSTQPISILYTFDSCTACNNTYYELTNCLDETQVIYTSSDITLNTDNCDCINITVVKNGITYEIETNYQTDIPGYSFNIDPDITLYQIIWNLGTEVWDLFYNNLLIGTLETSSNCPSGNFEILTNKIVITFLSAEPCTSSTVISIEECPGCWIVRETREPINPTTVTQLETYDNCEDCEIIPPTPTPEILPKRKVKPGYSTPTCDIEKYEKITCRSSEILYKEVMRLRYGLTNCCPEDDEKWLIKKELIDLDALRDPDYICRPTTSCCNQPITSCGCTCNNSLKTCNS